LPKREGRKKHHFNDFRRKKGRSPCYGKKETNQSEKNDPQGDLIIIEAVKRSRSNKKVETTQRPPSSKEGGGKGKDCLCREVAR